MNRDTAKSLLEKHKSGTLSEAEMSLLESWYLQQEVEKSDLTEAELQEDFKRIRSQLPLLKKSKSIRLWPQIAVAAAGIAAITLGIWFYTSSINDRNPDSSLSSLASKDLNDISPGGNTATLTLANGEVINLDTNKSSVVVTDSVKTSMTLTASTPRGGTYQVVLPDGTRIWLNAASSIKFPSSFKNEKQRSVELRGEGYFEVARDKKHPFVVITDHQQVEVLGTHFNISNYADESSVKTTLLEGSVKVSFISSSRETDRSFGQTNSTDLSYRDEGKSTAAVLKPGQQATNDGKKMHLSNIDADDAIAWKNGYFRFKDMDIQNVMKQISRWYNVEIVYSGPVTEAKFNGAADRTRNIAQVLRMLEKTKEVHFKIEEGRIYVYK